MNKKDIKRVAKMSATEVKKRAKNYVKNCEEYDVNHCGGFEVEDMEKAYTDGFNQGKESRICDCITYLNFDTLEKENAGLREDNNGLREENEELKRKLHEKSRAYSENFFFICNEKNDDFNKMVKKLRCCQNCSKCMLTEDNRLECVDDKEINTVPCDKWEMVE